MRVPDNQILFVLELQASRTPLVVAKHIEGFFEVADDTATRVSFVGVRALDEQRSRADDVVLNIVSRTRGLIGQYMVGRVELREVHRTARGDVARADYEMGGSDETLYALPIWQRWAQEIPVALGEWSTWPTRAHEAWLLVSQHVWATSRREYAPHWAPTEVHINGELLRSRASFYCALGEAVCGAGGYLGSNLDALNDCLRLSMGAGPLRIVWDSFHQSMVALDEHFVGAVVEVLEEHGVQVVFR